MIPDAPLLFPCAEPSVMGMPHAAERWTADRIRGFPDDGNRYELVSGTLVVTPAPAPRHQAAASGLFRRLDPFVETHGIGSVYWSPADLSLGEDEILQPDLFVFRTNDRRPPARWSDITSLVLAIEIVSPGSARYDRGLKRLRYQRAGVPEYWVVDLDARLVERWRPGDDRPEIVTGRLTWAPDAGGELSIDLAALFGDLAGTGAAL